MSSFKSGFVSIIGRPNVGKSTFLNTIMKTKVSIVTSKAQTTRDKIQGIYTTENEQIVFIDTPGVHKSFNKLGEVMNDFAFDSLNGIDLIIYIVDATKKFDDLDTELMSKLKDTNIPTILVFNKLDLIKDKERFNQLVQKYTSFNDYLSVESICSINYIDALKVLDKVVEFLPEGPQYYPDDQLMDHDERFVVKEVVREKVLLNTSQEVPHSVAVSVESFKEDTKNPNLLNINCEIICERQSQKGIIIGKDGLMLKKIGRQARLDLERFFGKKIYLELFVKVEADWRNRQYYLKSFGYKLDKK